MDPLDDPLPALVARRAPPARSEPRRRIIVDMHRTPRATSRRWCFFSSMARSSSCRCTHTRRVRPPIIRADRRTGFMTDVVMTALRFLHRPWPGGTAGAVFLRRIPRRPVSAVPIVPATLCALCARTRRRHRPHGRGGDGRCRLRCPRRPSRTHGPHSGSEGLRAANSSVFRRIAFPPVKMSSNMGKAPRRFRLSSGCSI